ncbi:MAG: GNAT family N-acetyltransferase [Deltaproteobacteria bacterium]|nr:MAG: GNAT family N-acetyltransferase [Deltaproteobacteria bacterium]
MVPTIRVREADESDRDVLTSFHRSLYQSHRDDVVDKDDLPLIDYQDYERVLHDDLNALLKAQSTQVLVAESDGVAVGYITGRITVEHRRVLPRRGVVEDWYVVPESRGAGVGALLLAKLEKRFAEAGCEVIESATWSGNEGARRAHDALGFREIRVMYRKRI